MRAKEFIKENKLSKDAIDSIPSARTWPELDNSSPYHGYRFGMALAGAPTEDMDVDGPVMQKLVTVSYTDADEEIVNAASKKMGFRSKNLTTKDSTETDVNSTSPVAKKKKNKYGV